MYLLGNEFDMIIDNDIEKIDNNLLVMCNRIDYNNNNNNI